MFAEVDVRMFEQLGAMGVVCVVLVLGARWLISHVTSLSDRYYKLIEDQLDKNREVMEKLGGIIGENTSALNRMNSAVEKCESANVKKGANS